MKKEVDEDKVALTAICNSLECQSDLDHDPHPKGQWEGYCSICNAQMKKDAVNPR